MDIQTASPPDLAEIQSIYAHHVLHGAGTFEELPPSIEQMTSRHDAGVAAGFDWVVARDATGVLGYGYYGPFRARSAYDWTVEDSVYVREDVRGQGVGKAIVARILMLAEAKGYRQMLALIGDADNIGSIGMHLSLGFTRAGVMRSCGVKFGQWRTWSSCKGHWAQATATFQGLTTGPGDEAKAGRGDRIAVQRGLDLGAAGLCLRENHNSAENGVLPLARSCNRVASTWAAAVRGAQHEQPGGCPREGDGVKHAAALG